MAVFLGQYLEKPGVKEERVGSLCIVVTVQVKITELIQVSVQGVGRGGD